MSTSTCRGVRRTVSLALDHEDELVAAVQRHAWEAHSMALSPDQALLLAFRAELDATAPARKPAHNTSQPVMSVPWRGGNKPEKEEM